MTSSEPDVAQSYPLSAAQRRLWFIAQLNPESCAYTNGHLIRLSGRLDTARLRAAMQAVIDRHDALRMRFVHAAGPGSDVAAVVDPSLTIEVPVHELNDCSADTGADHEARIVRRLTRQPFDLAAGPLVRAAIVETGVERHTFVLAVHHIVSDRWSFGILLREIAAFYDAALRDERADLPPLVVGYGDCARAEAADDERADAHLAYWSTVLAGERPILELPADRARPPMPSDRGAVVALTLSAALVRDVARVGAARKATPFMTFFAAYFVLLGRTTGQTDILIGTPVAGRSRLEREPLIGLFVNTLPVRVSTLADQSFTDVLANVRTATLGMLAHADVPFDRLVRAELAGRDGSRNPFFDVIFNFHNTPATAAWPDALDVHTEDVDTGTARIDLAVVLRPEADGSMTLRFEYSSDLFERSTIETIAEHFRAVLVHLAAAPDVAIAELPIATAAELETIVNVWSRPPSGAPSMPLETTAQTIDLLVAERVARDPDAVALVEDDAPPLTYAQLDRRANQLAHALRANGIGCGARVGLFLERSAHAVVAMLATLKAGAAYVPLDPAYPLERTAAMLASAGVAAIVARRSSFATLAPHALPLLDVDDPAHHLLDGRQPPAHSDDPDGLAYVIFTSGSTGAPKAVGVAHGGLVTFITRTRYLECTPADSFLLHAALTFDASILLWVPLVSGARVAIMPARPFSLAEFDEQLTKHAVTLVDLSPALFHQLVDERISCLRGLRRCTVGGDVLSPAQSLRFVRELPGCRLFNCYGPTEATIATTYYEVFPDATERHQVPIGRPIADARVYLLDTQRRPVPIGVAGELWIGGPGVARGYINDPVLTAERFVPDPFAMDLGARLYRSGDRARWLPSGDITFLGRSDAQVKIRGFRIEPAEIEFALLDHPAVRHAAVVARGTSAERYLMAYVELRTRDVDEAMLRTFLHMKLPSHAIPARIVVLDALPKTSSGKLDRGALPEVVVGDSRRLGAPAVTELQQQLVRMWETLLGTGPIGIDDDFFALGGHSLLAARLIGEIERAFGTRLPLAVLFERPTVEHLAEALRQDPANLNRSPLVALNPGGTAAPLFFLHGSIAGGGYYCLGLAQKLGSDRPLFVMRPHGVDGRALPPAIETIAQECIATLKAARPHGPYLIGGFCSGGLVALEVARQLVARGERVDHLILVDVPNAEPGLRAALDGLGRLARYAGIPAARRSAQRARLSRFARSVRSFTETHGKRALVRRCGHKLRAAFDPGCLFVPALGEHDAGPRSLAEAWRWLGQGYVARTYRGRATILLSDEYRRRDDVHVDAWPAVAPLADIRPIPGEHLTCITDHLDATAKEIAEALR